MRLKILTKGEYDQNDYVYKFQKECRCIYERDKNDPQLLAKIRDYHYKADLLDLDPERHNPFPSKKEILYQSLSNGDLKCVIYATSFCLAILLILITLLN